MELSSILAGLVFLALITVPFYWMSKSGSKKRKALLAKYQNLAGSLGLSIGELDTWNDMVLGLDRNARKLLYFKNKEGDERHILVELSRVSFCKKVNISRNAKAKSETTNVIDVLGLELLMKDAPATVLLEFYNSNNSFILHEELLLIGKWSDIVNGMLKK